MIKYTSRITKRVEEFYAEVEGSSSEAARLFTEQLYSSLVSAVRTYNRTLIAFLLAWLVMSAIGAGIIREAQSTAIRIEEVLDLLIVAPMGLSLLAHAVAYSAEAHRYLHDAVAGYFKEHLPEAHARGLVVFVSPVSLTTAESYSLVARFKLWPRIVSWVWRYFLGLLFLLGPAASVAHASYLLWTLTDWPAPLKAVAVGVSLLPLARAYGHFATMFVSGDENSAL
jgi:hypothetical protein